MPRDFAESLLRVSCVQLTYHTEKQNFSSFRAVVSEQVVERLWSLFTSSQQQITLSG